MTASNNLEIKGNLSDNPFAELLLEISEAHLTGSLRLGFESEKVIFYFIGGKLVFIVSNARRHRLFEILLRENIISQDQLADIPEFTNDFAVCNYLKSNKMFSEADTDSFFAKQFEEILKAIFERTSGEWIFSPQTRIKEGIRFKIKTTELLLQYGRSLSDSEISARFKSLSETFGVKSSASTDAVLLPPEGFVLSRFEGSSLTLNEIIQMCGLPDSAVLRVIYTLWLSGFLLRQKWNAAFTERKISDILSAKFILRKEAVPAPTPVVKSAKIASETPDERSTEPAPETEGTKSFEIRLDKYLEQIEEATNLYEVLGLPVGSDFQEIKRRYFLLAKQFHPDMFHKEKDADLVQKIQNAFALTAQAYETLKNDETRKVYDYKLEKSLSAEKTEEPSVVSKPDVKQPQNANTSAENFEHGFDLLMDDKFQEAVPFMARAVQLEPNNAKYHAYYGKALSGDKSQRYQADMELQTAIRLDFNNVTYRMMSAEFYIEFGLFKRAEGELKRLLNIDPNNSEALKLMKSLPKK